MERDLKSLEGAFRSERLIFVCEATHHDIELPGVERCVCETVHEVLASSGALPALSGAPVASWLLARLARLAGKRFPYLYGEVPGSDAGDIWVRYFVLAETGKPIGILSVSA